MAEAVDHLGIRPPASALRPAHAVSSISLGPPDSEDVTVHLDEFGLGPLLLHLLPQTAEYQVDGVPGLRYQQGRRHVQLVLLETTPRARLIFAGVNARTWAAAVRFVDESYTDQCRRWLWQGEHASTVSVDEKNQLRRIRRVRGPVHLASSLFRRHRVLSGSLGVPTRGSRDQWNLEWIGGPSPAEVGTRLLHPIFGLPGQFDLRHVRDESAVLVERMTDEHPPTGDKPNKLFLLRTPAPTPQDDERERRTFRGGWTAWEAWAAELKSRRGHSRQRH
ncbi:hypothetical protein ACI2K4_18680 [Micromonospora sp. NPDC050397]|uniref:hypothetical protein n=1 Tax=Micromonospora sp. NPDC050397 TaxID=3364279 RepID=UPI00384CD827